MNRSSIEWTRYTWNPVTGCKHGCTYCYARRLAEGRLKGRFGYDNGFEPTFHQNRLLEPQNVKKPSMIFTCSMGDLFGEWVPRQWINYHGQPTPSVPDPHQEPRTDGAMA